MENLGFVGTAAQIAALILLLSVVLSLIAMIRGPSLADRVVALDLITMLALAFAGVTAVATGHPALLDVGISLALVAFLATLAFAWYIERKAERTASEGPVDSAGEEG